MKMRNHIDFCQSAEDIFQLLYNGHQADETCAAACVKHVNLHVWAREETCPHAIPYFPGVPTGTSGESMLSTCAWRRRCDWLHAYAAVQTHLTTCRASPAVSTLQRKHSPPEQTRRVVFKICPHTGAVHVSLTMEAAACYAKFLGEYVSNSLLALVVFCGVRTESMGSL